MTPIDTVKHMYAAYGRGDVPAILACLAEDVQWQCGDAPNPVPWLQPFQGRAQVPGFFEALQRHVEMHRFEPHHFLADGPWVVSLFDVEFTVRATGCRVAEKDAVHLWQFDAAGRVATYRQRVDTWTAARALRGSLAAEATLGDAGRRAQPMAAGKAAGGVH